MNTNGTLSWEYNIGSNLGTSYAVTGLNIDGRDVVYAGAWDNYLYALNSDGTLRWRYLTGGDVRSGIAFSPSEDTVYFGSYDGYLYALELTSASVAVPEPSDDLTLVDAIKSGKI